MPEGKNTHPKIVYLPEGSCRRSLFMKFPEGVESKVFIYPDPHDEFNPVYQFYTNLSMVIPIG